MEKEIIEKRILNLSRSITRLEDNRYTWGDIKEILKEKNITLQDDDIIFIEFSESYDYGDSARDAAYDLTIIRRELESDGEYEKRVKEVERMKKNALTHRYEHYLKLKEEFEKP